MCKSVAHLRLSFLFGDHKCVWVQFPAARRVSTLIMQIAQLASASASNRGSSRSASPLSSGRLSRLSTAAACLLSTSPLLPEPPTHRSIDTLLSTVSSADGIQLARLFALRRLLVGFLDDGCRALPASCLTPNPSLRRTGQPPPSGAALLAKPRLMRCCHTPGD